MAGNEFALHQAVLHAAKTLEVVRVLCDRTHEETILAARDGMTIEVACHYAYAMGTVMAVVMQELESLQKIGVRRAELNEEANARAAASLEAFKRSLQRISA